MDKENKQAKGDLREGHYACRGVPWVEDKGTEAWPDQWPSEVWIIFTHGQEGFLVLGHSKSVSGLAFSVYRGRASTSQCVLKIQIYYLEEVGRTVEG